MTKTSLQLRIVLMDPPADVDYGVQRGRGSKYDVDFLQRPKRGDVAFDFTVNVARGKDGTPNFLGEYVQGPTGRRFVYVDVGKYAGQKGTPWARRMIVRLDEITWPMIQRAVKGKKCLEARVPGIANDGGPNCATVNILGGWQVTSI